MEAEDIAYDKLRQALDILGVKHGDVLLLKADFTEIGLVAKTAKGSRDLVFRAIWDAIGGPENGTIVTSSFTEIFPRWNLTDFVFDKDSPSKNGGALTKYFLQHPDVVRSSHPTNSFVAIGRHARYLTEKHDARARQYDPVGRVIDLNGRALSLGSVHNPPDFMTGHYAQQEAGLTTGTIVKYFTGVKYREGEEVKIFKVKEVGGCSRGHKKVYAEYVASRKLRSAFFGSAYSISMPARDAFEISLRLQKQDPRSFLCDDPNCFSCRGTWLWNLRDWPLYYLRNIGKVFKNLFRK